MTHDEYKESLRVLGLTHITAGQFLGVSWRHSYRWAKGSTPVPKSVSLLLTLCIELSLFPEQVEDMAVKPAGDLRQRALG